ncbi:MAG TPA: PKD domain-containing protein [Solirubrobacterales bacterium]|nr:PKD domain-containing protein [Solirubrobacterales bacterium]
MPKAAPTLFRLGFLLALGALALSLFAAERARADAAQVTVVSPGGAQQTISLAALAGREDVVARPYLLRAAVGETTQTLSGFSPAAILDAAGADPYGFSYLEVQRPAGGAVLLSRDQALDAGAFADGPPLVYATAAGTGFLRPSTGPEDLNADDSFEAPQGISLVLRKGSRLQVRAKASTRRTRPGKPVSFSAIVEQAGSGEQLTYSWYFDDGASAASAEATHSFAKRGSYDVVVGVTSDGDDTGASAVVTIQVGAPIAGPDRKGGGTDKDAEAPDHGVADSPLGGLGESGGGVPPVSAPPTDSTTPAPSSSPPTPSTADKPPVPKTPPGEQVVGELVSATADVPSEAPKQVAARSGQLQDDGSGGGLPGAAWGLLATLGLLGAGALIETRSLFG